MAVRIVDLLEMIEIDEDQRELVVVTLRTVNFCFENEAHVTGVVETGAIVGDGQLVNAFHVTGVFERDGGEVGKSFEQLEVAIVKSFRAEAIDQFDHAEASVTKFYGNGDDRLRLGFRLFVHLAEKARVLGSVRHDHGFSVLSHPSGDSLPDLNANIFQRLRSLADRQLEVEFLFGLIQQEQRPVVRAQKLVYFLHDGAKNLVELQRRRQRLPQLLEDRNLARFTLYGEHRGIAAAFHGRKLLYFVHARLVPALKSLKASPLPPRQTTPRARFVAGPRIFASIGASQKRVQESRGTGVAILPSAGTGRTGGRIYRRQFSERKNCAGLRARPGSRKACRGWRVCWA